MGDRVSQVVVVVKDPFANAGAVESGFDPGQQDPLEGGSSYSVILPGESHVDRRTWWAMVQRVTRVEHLACTSTLEEKVLIILGCNLHSEI